MRNFLLLLILVIPISSNSFGQTSNSFIRIDTINSDYKNYNGIHADSIDSYGIVVIKVMVNRNGDVISADPLPDKSTTTDSVLLKLAKDAALRAKFDINVNPVSRQIGFITYKFKMTKN